MTDPLLDQLPTVPFGDLNLALDHGLAYQPNPQPFTYGEDYWHKYQGYDSMPIADRLNEFRCQLVEEFTDSILDVGIGSGIFIQRTKAKAWGFDINPLAIDWLKARSQYLDPYSTTDYPFKAWTFWDSLEHVPEPSLLLSRVTHDQHVFVSVPIHNDLTKLRQWKHFRPHEHLTYFTAQGLIGFAKQFGLQLVELSDEETQLGRQDILTFVFYKK